MPGTSTWTKERAKRITTPERERAVLTEQAHARLELLMAELRRHRGLSQDAVAAALRISQPAVSKLERGDDIRLSTIEGYIGALGGRLELRAVFDNETVLIKGRPQHVAS